MPVCVACGEWGRGPLCVPCGRRLSRGGTGAVAGVPVHSAFHHSATARVLVHRLKYHGLGGAADVLAAAMAPLLPPAATALVAVPRARLRRIVYGVDPARELARRIGAQAGLGVADALAAPLWWPRHAGRVHVDRRAPSFTRRGPVSGGVVLVDDVVTSGATLRGAVAALGGQVLAAITATSPGMMEPSKAPIASRRLRDGTAAGQKRIATKP